MEGARCLRRAVMSTGPEFERAGEIPDSLDFIRDQIIRVEKLKEGNYGVVVGSLDVVLKRTEDYEGVEIINDKQELAGMATALIQTTDHLLVFLREEN